MPVRYQLLHVDFDAEMRRLVAMYLEGYELDVVGAGSVADARSLLDARRFDLVVLDLVTSCGDGWDLLLDLAARRRPPVLITSTRGDEADRILALEAGADDFLAKPFSFRELVARSRAIARRMRHEPPAAVRRVATFDAWSLDLAARRAESGSRVVELTAGEMAILRTLMERPHHVLTRTELLAASRQGDGEAFDRTVDVLVSRLRRKLESDPFRPEVIQTIRGGGYCFTRDVSWRTAV